MPEIEVNIEIYCGKCGAGLCGDTRVGKRYSRGEPVFEVTPCDKCMTDEYDRGFEEGMAKGEATYDQT